METPPVLIVLNDVRVEVARYLDYTDYGRLYNLTFRCYCVFNWVFSRGCDIAVLHISYSVDWPLVPAEEYGSETDDDFAGCA